MTILFKKAYREVAALVSKIYVGGLPVRYRGYTLIAPMVHGIRNGGYYIECEDFMLNCLRDAVNSNPESKVLDVGANVGLLLTQLRSFNDNIHYYGVEPNVGNCFFCNTLIEKNSFPNSWVYPVALGAENNLAKLTLKKSKKGDPGAYVSGYSVNKPNDDRYHELPINLMKGDDFVNMAGLDNISFIKIDVEGNECEVISGLSEVIETHRPDIFCEVAPESAPRATARTDQSHILGAIQA